MWTADSTFVIASTTQATADGWLYVSIAEYAIVNLGLILTQPINWITSSLVPYGGVISMTPTPTSLLSAWTLISITVSSGPPNVASTVTVPNLVGLQAYQANTQAASAGLIVSTATYATSNSVAAGLVISQSLTAGSTQAQGATITLTVSLGAAVVAATTTVPNVVGVTRATALTTLNAAQLIPNVILYAGSNTVALETVISQSLTAGSVVATWTNLTLTISSGPL